MVQPTLDLNGADDGTSSSIDYQQSDPLAAIAPQATVDDPDSPNFFGGSLIVEFTSGATADDLLAVLHGAFTVDENSLYYNFSRIGSISGGTADSPMTILFDQVIVENDHVTVTEDIVQQLVRSIAFGSFGESAAAGTRTITFTLSDGGDGTATPATAEVTVEPLGDPVARNDSFTTSEDVPLIGNVLDDNGGGADDAPVQVTAVNNDPDAVGETIILSSGASLTLNEDGTFTYDPTTAFDYLAGQESGAANTSAVDTFTYTITGGDTATVTINVNGEEGGRDILRGTGGDDRIVGTPYPDFFRVEQGGNDTLIGLESDDVFYFGGAMTSADKVDGREGNDQIGLQGNYSGPNALAFGTEVVAVESLVLLPGNDTRFDDTANNSYDYNITMVNENVAAGLRFIIDANRLRPGEDFTFNGSAETDGSFLIYGGGGTDNLTGGSNTDVFLFGAAMQWGASDVVNGGGGTDQLALRGDYVIVFGAGQLVSIEQMVLLSAHDTRFGRLGDNYSYDLTMDDGNVAGGTLFTLDATNLRPTEGLTFDGSAEQDGRFRIFGGGCDDHILTGLGDDILVGGPGSDYLNGGGGRDTFVYRSIEDSLPPSGPPVSDDARVAPSYAGPDTIDGFDTLIDKVDLSKIDADDFTEGNQAFRYIGNLEFSGAGASSAGELRVYRDADCPTLWFAEADVNGDGQADMMIVFINTVVIQAGDFVL
jgi:VCBS repeat-containing protein